MIEGHGWSPLASGSNPGASWWDLASLAKAGGYAKSLNAPKIVNFQPSTNIGVSGITIHNAPLVHMLFGRDIRNAGAGSVTVVIGGEVLRPFYFGPAPGFAGLDQVDVFVPHNCAGQASVNVFATAGAAISKTGDASVFNDFQPLCAFIRFDP